MASLNFEIGEEILNGIERGKMTLNVKVGRSKRMNIKCPIDGEKCELSIQEVLSCDKFKRLIKLQKEGSLDLTKQKEIMIG